MVVDTISEAKAQLSSLIEQVEKGGRVIICRNGRPVAVLAPYAPTRKRRVPGALRGKVTIGEEFDRLPPDLEQALGVTTP